MRTSRNGKGRKKGELANWLLRVKDPGRVWGIVRTALIRNVRGRNGILGIRLVTSTTLRRPGRPRFLPKCFLLVTSRLRLRVNLTLLS